MVEQDNYKYEIGTFGSVNESIPLSYIMERLNDPEFNSEPIAQYLTKVNRITKDLQSYKGSKSFEYIVKCVRKDYLDKIDLFSNQYKYSFITRVRNFTDTKFKKLLQP